MPSFEKPTSIALFPTAADRSTQIPTSHQQHYLSPPLTPYPFQTYNDKYETNTIDSPFVPSLPAFREMLPREDRRQTPPIESEHHVYPLPAMPHHSEMDVTGLAEPNSASTPRGAHHISDPARLLPLYSVQPHGTGLSSSLVSPLLRRNKAHVASACVNCKKAHLACDANRPCRRCVSLDKQDSCVDVQHKRRGRPRLKDSAPSANSLQSERRPSYLHRHVSDDSWKLQSSPSFARDSYRREYHHNRSYSHESQPAVRHHPYSNPTPPTSAYGTHGPSRNPLGYFDIPSPSVKHPYYPAPNSPSYYSYSESPQLGGHHGSQTFPTPSSPYQSEQARRAEFRFSQPITHSLLPPPDPHPSLLRRGSFPSNLAQSEIEHARRPSLSRAETTPAHTTERRPEWGSESETGDSVKLPSLKDLGVPFR